MSIKRNDELSKGDVIHTQFGADGNWITAVVDSVENVGGFLNIKIKAHLKNCGCDVVMYGKSEESVEVVE